MATDGERWSTGTWIGIAGVATAIGGLWLAYQSERRRQREAAAATRCRGWWSLSDGQLAAYYRRALVEPINEEFGQCLAAELHSRGGTQQASEVWQRLIEQQREH